MIFFFHIGLLLNCRLIFNNLVLLYVVVRRSYSKIIPNGVCVDIDVLFRFEMGAVMVLVNVNFFVKEYQTWYDEKNEDEENHESARNLDLKSTLGSHIGPISKTQNLWEDDTG